MPSGSLFFTSFILTVRPCHISCKRNLIITHKSGNQMPNIYWCLCECFGFFLMFLILIPPSRELIISHKLALNRNHIVLLIPWQYVLWLAPDDPDLKSSLEGGLLRRRERRSWVTGHRHTAFRLFYLKWVRLSVTMLSYLQYRRCLIHDNNNS